MPLNGAANFPYVRALSPRGRALMGLQLVGPGSTAPRLVVQLDSGSDWTLVDAHVAQRAGHVVAGLPLQAVTLASGSQVRLPLLRGATVRIETHPPISLDVLLVAQGAPQLLAVRDLLRVAEFGCDVASVFFD